MEKKVQNYVIIKNLRKAPNMFSSHQQSQITLTAFGSKDDAVKILLSDDNLVGQMRHYDTLKKGGEFQVVFSSGLDGESIPDSKSKMTVHSTAEVQQRTADVVAALRSKQATQARDDKNASARLELAKAQAVANGARPEKPVKVAAEAGSDRTPVQDDGVELTPENLSKMSKPQLFEIARSMKLQVRPGASHGGLVKAILLNVK